MRRSLVATASLLLAGCATFTVGDTPAQALARDRWRSCDHFVTLRLDRIEASGRVLLSGKEIEGQAARECMQAALAEQRRKGAEIPADPGLVIQTSGGTGRY
jgi:hypothetical protein